MSEQYLLLAKNSTYDKNLFIGNKEECLEELNKILDKSQFHWTINEYFNGIYVYVNVKNGMPVKKNEIVDSFSTGRCFYQIIKPSYNDLDIEHIDAVVISNY